MGTQRRLNAGIATQWVAEHRTRRKLSGLAGESSLLRRHDISATQYAAITQQHHATQDPGTELCRCWFETRGGVSGNVIGLTKDTMSCCILESRNRLAANSALSLDNGEQDNAEQYNIYIMEWRWRTQPDTIH